MYCLYNSCVGGGFSFEKFVLIQHGGIWVNGIYSLMYMFIICLNKPVRQRERVE